MEPLKVRLLVPFRVLLRLPCPFAMCVSDADGSLAVAYSHSHSVHGLVCELLQERACVLGDPRLRRGHPRIHPRQHPSIREQNWAALLVLDLR